MAHPVWKTEEITTADDELCTAVERLTLQLSKSTRSVSPEVVAAVVASPSTRLLAVRTDDGAIVGLLTLVVFRLATGVRALIEDVVVDNDHRRRGIGEALVRDAVALATELRARTVELTSRPERAEANRLYLRLGFDLRDTNAYRLTLAP